MADKDVATDIRLISEFDGVTQVVSEWLEKFELVCKVRDRKDAELASLVPLRLTGGAFAAWVENVRKSYPGRQPMSPSGFGVGSGGGRRSDGPNPPILFSPS